MNNNTSIIWIKSSVVGTVWAASEIVFGSFLHNLKIPFSGNILTAIGIITLISLNYRWKDRGLFWRAAIICALMKTMSPSAVIFGPMIAIISQGFIMEFFTRFFGRNIFGYIIGSIFAMLWNLFQKILNIILFYSLSIVEIYESLVQIAEKQLNISYDLTWIPLIILIVLYVIFGIIAGIIGIKIGSKSNLSQTTQSINTNSNYNSVPKSITSFSHSLYWLGLNLFFIVSSLIAIQSFNTIVWIIYILAIVALWTSRYKRALRQLKKPTLWITFITITFITSILAIKMQQSATIMDGIIAGVQMNFRAIIIILGFSTLGTELYNPIIIEHLFKSRFKQLPIALKMAFNSLPLFIASLPDFKTIIKKPFATAATIILQAEQQLEILIQNEKKQIFIITGCVNEGKTWFIKELINLLQQNNITVRGLYSEKIFSQNQLLGYDIVNIKNREQEPFLRITNKNYGPQYGRFSIITRGLEKGKEILTKAQTDFSDVIVIDEIGNMELENNGWVHQIESLIKKSNRNLIISIRNEFVEKTIAKWEITNLHILKINNFDPQKAFQYYLDNST